MILDEVFALLKLYNYLGEEKLDDGTLLIAKAPHIAPLAWLHSIYPVLIEEEFFLLEAQLGTLIPDEYKMFLTEISNGLNIFSSALSLDGFRKLRGRDIIAAYQPFSLVTPNTIEKPRNADERHFFIGGYSWGKGMLLYIDKADGKIYSCNRRDATPVNEWPSFEIMLYSEVNRLKDLHDENGKRLK